MISNVHPLKQFVTLTINERDERVIVPMKTDNYAADNLDIR